METSRTADPIFAVGFFAVLFAYAVIYFVAKAATIRLTRSGPDAALPRWIALGAVIAAATMLAIWLRSNFVDPRVYASLNNIDQVQYAVQAMSFSIVPAVVSVLVILYRICRALDRQLENKRQQSP